MAIRLINYVNNQLNSPALWTGVISERPAAGIYGRLFMSSDSKEIYQDQVSSWALLADAGVGSGTLLSVTGNGNYTTYGIVINAGDLNITNPIANLFVKKLTIGSVLFPVDSSGQIGQDNANFFWDNTNKRLGIGTATPGSKLDIHSTGINATFNGTTTNNAYLVFQNAGTSKWYTGNTYSSAVANDFVIYDAVNSITRFYVHNTGVINIPSSLIIGTTTPTSSYAFETTGTGRFSGTLTLGTITAGSVLFATTSGLISQDNATFFWDTTNKRLGIGTSSPANTLDVQTSSGVGSSTASGLARFITASTTTAISVGQANSARRIDIGSQSIKCTGDDFYLNNGGANATIFENNGAERMRILANGTIQLGLEVYNTVTSGTTRTLFIGNGTYSIGGVSSIKASKKNIKEFDSKWIYDLKPIEFNYRKKDENGSYTEEIFEEVNYGLIAEDTQPIADFLINYDENEDGKKMVGIEYSRLITPMLKAIQELNEKLIRNNIN